MNPPNSPPYYLLWAKKVDHELARNILLNFIHEHDLDEAFMEYYQYVMEAEE